MRGRHSTLCVLFLSTTLTGCWLLPEDQKPTPPKPTVSAPGSVDADAPEEFTSTPSGLKYRIRRKSDGVKPNPDQTIQVHYRGWLDDGTIFDTNYGTGGVPTSFVLKNTVAGWREGMLLIGEGGMIELEVPYDQGYGEQGSPPQIPPKATLHFLIELVKVMETPKLPTDINPMESGKGGLEPGKPDSDAPEEFTTTESGLKYRILRKSDGKKPTRASSVKVHYRGKLTNGREFDSSYARSEPATFALNGVIAGWTEGLQLIGVGGMIELQVPSKLAYGDAGNPPAIPPNSDLNFLVELLEVR